MDYFPFFFDLRNKPCLIVGGGEIARRKAKLIFRAGAQIDVVAPEIESELASISKASKGRLIKSTFTDGLVNGYVLVIGATDSDEVNARVSARCFEENIPVNVVDSPELCSIITPAIIDRNPLIVAVSSGGEAPVLARNVKAQIDKLLPGAYGKLAQFTSTYRVKIKQTFDNIDLRRRFWESVINGPIGESVLAGNETKAHRSMEACLRQKQVDSSGEVYLVGAGPGDPDLLTFKALRLMQKAEVVLYDRLVSEPIMDMVRKDAELIYVGKKQSEHAVPQSQINQMLLNYANQGRRVLRLKGGDPFIFGRGAEEIELLAENGVAFQVVPGITAASGCASYAGIPLTHRDYSQSVRFVTGHVKDGVLNFRWKEFVEDTQTLVFYMGLTGIKQICDQLMQHGKDPETPAALVEKGTLPEQKVHLGKLHSLPELVARENVHAPTLLIIGGVVSLHGTLKWYKK